MGLWDVIGFGSGLGAFRLFGMASLKLLDSFSVVGRLSSPGRPRLQLNVW